ncbi:MAG: hypothetical protein ABL886_15035 [Rhodoglobus sp.]
MTATTRKGTKIVRYLTIPLALVASGLLVAQASYSAYSTTTANPTSNWTTGTLALTDDDSNTALFTASSLVPGSTGTKCIVVTSASTVPTTIKLYGTTPSTTLALSTWIDLTVTLGAGGSNATCTGFVADITNPSVYSGTLAAFGTSATSFSNGLGVWAPAAAGSKTYRFVYTVNSAAPNSTAGGTAAIGFTWEAQTN